MALPAPTRPPAALAGFDESAEYISQIKGIKGVRTGKKIEDQFEIESTELVEALVGPFNNKGCGSLALRKQNTAVMLVPPLQFTFKTERAKAGEDPRKFATELTVTGHFITLVDRKAQRKNPLWKFDDERADYSAENKLAYKMALAAAMRELGPAIVPKHILKFLEIL